jgi:minor histocompatibility antigen H13
LARLLLPLNCLSSVRVAHSALLAVLRVDFSWTLALSILVAAIVCGVYVYTRNWILNNLLAICFSVTFLMQLPVGSYSIASILLAGLFVYDVFWVFGTNVMVTVALGIDAPIKLILSKELLTNATIFSPGQASILGLGDIVMPGLLVALLARFDHNQVTLGKPRSGPSYLSVGMFAYVLGLVVTIFVMHTFKAAQVPRT